MIQLPKRLHSIDIFRAVTMLLMIFVNDASSLKNIPVWIEHVAAKADGLGFADTVFPAFLFIVGLSIPFAISNRLKKGDTFFNIALYILTRSAALLVMGFFHVNSEDYSHTALLPRAVWIILITIGFFMIWLDYPPSMSNTKKYCLVGGGVMLLIAMAWLYKGGDALAPHGMQPSWWGILGIIGWAYLVCAFVFLLTNGKLSLLIATWIIFTAINIAAHTGMLPFKIWIIGDASSASLVMGGIVINGIYQTLAGKRKDSLLWTLLTACGVALIVAGFLIRPFAGGISKIYATPAWVFICSGISVLVFELMIWLIDINKKQQWFSFIRPAGTSTLTCYLLPYLLYSLLNLLHFQYPVFLSEGIVGLTRSFAVAFLIIWLTGILERYRLRLKI
jgi:predicted acyltransferase